MSYYTEKWWFSGGLWHFENTRTGANLTLIRPLCGGEAFFALGLRFSDDMPSSDACPKCRAFYEQIEQAVKEVDEAEVDDLANSLEREAQSWPTRQ